MQTFPYLEQTTPKRQTLHTEGYIIPLASNGFVLRQTSGGDWFLKNTDPANEFRSRFVAYMELHDPHAYARE